MLSDLANFVGLGEFPQKLVSFLPFPIEVTTLLLKIPFNDTCPTVSFLAFCFASYPK